MARSNDTRPTFLVFDCMCGCGEGVSEKYAIYDFNICFKRILLGYEAVTESLRLSHARETEINRLSINHECRSIRFREALGRIAVATTKQVEGDQTIKEKEAHDIASRALQFN